MHVCRPARTHLLRVLMEGHNASIQQPTLVQRLVLVYGHI